MSRNSTDLSQEALMARDDSKVPVDRRSFFKALGAGAAVTVAPVAITPAAAVDPGKEETKARYQDSEHVKNFYRVNRYL